LNQETPKPKQGLKCGKPLKSKGNPIPLKVKKAVLEQKGNRCFLGFCGQCKGLLCTVADDFHHKPKRSQLGKHVVAHLFPAKRSCHDYYETHPKEEKEMFKRMEAAGIPVVWRLKPRESKSNI
jgi:hypothetical protein